MVDRHTNLRLLGIDRSVGRDTVGITAQADISGIIRPTEAINIAAGVLRERARQDIRWGDTTLPDAPHGVKFPNAYFGVLSEDAAKMAVEVAGRKGLLSYGHIFVEEVAEALTAINATPAELRMELEQVSAVCQKWIEAIDRRQGFGGDSAKVTFVDELASKGEQP